MPKRTKALADMTVDEIYALEDGHSIHIGSSKAPPPPEKAYWTVFTFFVAAAVRKGAVNLPKWLKAKSSKSEIIRDGRLYRIECHFECQRKQGTFTVYSTGEWTYDAGPTYLEGKLQPPHSRQWLAKMMAKGTPGEIARQDLEVFRSMRKANS